jgi:pyrimidine-nucleoside phosphorylase
MATPYRILAAKRAGRPLTAAEIGSVVEGAVDGSWTEGQLAAFLMASAIQGLDVEETRALTLAMLESGDRWRLEREVPHLCDKHSTGGVGDKVSIVMTPLLAACGVPVSMLTGRGLGHTGGTADKLETIPGLALALDRRHCLRLLERLGMAIGIATAGIAPADQRFYLLRDSTATVDSLPLITASILSKKLATGAAGLVLDVKVGNGAVFEDLEGARALAQILVDTASRVGGPTSALLTDMNEPLGRWVGNAAEIRESLSCLAGEGPPRLMELVYELAEEVSQLAGRPVSRSELERAAASGAARDRFEAWVGEQGGQVGELERSSRQLAPVEVVIEAESDGVLAEVSCKELGFALVEAGAGRSRPDDVIDPGVSLHYRAMLGQPLGRGEEIARAYLREEDAALTERLRRCFRIADGAPFEPPPIVAGRVEASG